MFTFRVGVVVSLLVSTQAFGEPPSSKKPKAPEVSIADEILAYQKGKFATSDRLARFLAEEKKRFEQESEKNSSQLTYNRHLQTMDKIVALLTKPDPNWLTDEDNKFLALRLIDSLPEGAHQRFLAELDLLKHYSGPVAKRATALLLAKRVSNEALARNVPERGASPRPTSIDFNAWETKILGTTKQSVALQACPLPDQAREWWLELSRRRKTIEAQIDSTTREKGAYNEETKEAEKKLEKARTAYSSAINTNLKLFDGVRGKVESAQAKQLELAKQVYEVLEKMVGGRQALGTYPTLAEGMLGLLMPEVFHTPYRDRKFSPRLEIINFARGEELLVSPSEIAHGIRSVLPLVAELKKFAESQENFSEALNSLAKRTTPVTLTPNGIDALHSMFPKLKDFMYKNPENSAVPKTVRLDKIDELLTLISAVESSNKELVEVLPSLDPAVNKVKLTRGKLDQLRIDVQDSERELQKRSTENFDVKLADSQRILEKLDKEMLVLRDCLREATKALKDMRDLVHAGSDPHNQIAEPAARHGKAYEGIRKGYEAIPRR